MLDESLEADGLTPNPVNQVQHTRALFQVKLPTLGIPGQHARVLL